MKINGNVVLNQKELAYRWSVNIETVRNEVRRWSLTPVHFVGRQPFFSEQDVVKLEAERIRVRSEQIGIVESKNGFAYKYLLRPKARKAGAK